MTDTLLKMFDSWSDIIEKARKPKGLENWKKLEHVADKLQGKQVGNITFTSSHPSYEGKPVKHTLGSTIGNLHFLLGYANPGFHLAPYHWQIIDPYLTDEDVSSLEHPSKPELWARSGLSIEDEGDLEEGNPHPSIAASKQKEAAQKKRDAEAISVVSNGQQFVAVPSELRVYSLGTGHVYNWAVVKESFFAATNPQLKEVMDAVEDDNDVNDDLQAKPVEKSLPILVHSMLTDEEFEDNVYPLVKSMCPKPGSVFPITLPSEEKIFALIKSNCIEFYDEVGNEVCIPVYDRLYKSFDLVIDGNIHPSILFNFLSHYFGIEKSQLISHDSTKEEHSNVLIKGVPSVGFDDIAADKGTLPEERTVAVFGTTYKVTPRINS